MEQYVSCFLHEHLKQRKFGIFSTTMTRTHYFHFKEGEGCFSFLFLAPAGPILRGIGVLLALTLTLKHCKQHG